VRTVTELVRSDAQEAAVVESTSTGADVRHRLPVRKLVAASIGNAIEWYDWTIYTAFSVYFADAFFPGENESSS
jgi:hypothetical protein